MATGLARLTGRGALVNLGFTTAIQGLVAIQAVVVPRLIGPENIGLFSLAMGGVGIGKVLKSLGIPQKLIQERDVDLHTSYGVAFTLEIVLAGTFFLVVLAVGPILAVLYDQPELWLLTWLLGVSIFTTAFLELPAALPYREMRFVKRNLLLGVGPVVTFLVTVPTAFAGWGVWSLAAGVVAGFVAASVVMFLGGDMRPHLQWDRSLIRRYLDFGWPIWLGQILALASGWGAVFAVSSIVGVAGLGFFQMAQTLSNRALQVDQLLSNTVWPALCSMQSARDRLWRAFVVLNRLSMLWAAPAGFGLSIFADPFVRLILGEEWTPAIQIMQAFGPAIAITSIAYSWDQFLASQGITRPHLTASVLGTAWLGLVAVPALAIWDLDGLAVSLVVLAVGTYWLRQHYLRRVFGRFVLAGLVWRELLTAAVVATTIIAVRRAGWAVESIPALVAQGAVYAMVAFGAGALVSRDVVREAMRSVLPERRRRDAHAAAAPAASTPSTARLGVIATPRRMAFPLGLAADVGRSQAWVTTRDWPALGRLDLRNNEISWTELPPFPHVPTPDGRGGCWTALTRSSALVHVDASGEITTIDTPASRELLVTELDGDDVWIVDAGNVRLLRHRVGSSTVTVHELPDLFRRPDFVRRTPWGTLLVADTWVPVLAEIDPESGDVLERAAPHPTRFLVADPDRQAMWLGASDRGALTRWRPDDGELVTAELPDVPFGITVSGDHVLAALRDRDAIAVVAADTGVLVDEYGLESGSGPMDLCVVDDAVLVGLSNTSVVARLPRELLVGRTAVTD